MLIERLTVQGVSERFREFTVGTSSINNNVQATVQPTAPRNTGYKGTTGSGSDLSFNAEAEDSGKEKICEITTPEKLFFP